MKDCCNHGKNDNMSDKKAHLNFLVSLLKNNVHLTKKVKGFSKKSRKFS